MNEKNNNALELPREQYEPVLDQGMDMELLNAEITVNAFDISEDHVFKTCYGDVHKIVDALQDYSKQREPEIVGKLQAGIGYDYDAAMARCEKQKAKKQRDDDVGGEALAMGLLRAQQAAEANAKKAAEKKSGDKLSPTKEPPEDELWADDL